MSEERSVAQVAEILRRVREVLPARILLHPWEGGLRLWGKTSTGDREFLRVLPEDRVRVVQILSQGVDLPPGARRIGEGSCDRQAGSSWWLGSPGASARDIEILGLGPESSRAFHFRYRVWESSAASAESGGAKDHGLPPEILADSLAEPGLMLVAATPGLGGELLNRLVMAERERFPSVIQFHERPAASIPGAALIRANYLGLGNMLWESRRQDADLLVVGPTGDLRTLASAATRALARTPVLLGLACGGLDRRLVTWLSPRGDRRDIAPALRGVIHLVSVRLLCQDCRRPAPSDLALVLGLGDEGRRGRPIYQVGGCTACGGTGVRGQRELLAFTACPTGLREGSGPEVFRALLEPAWQLLEGRVLDLLRAGETDLHSVAWLLRKEG